MPIGISFLPVPDLPTRVVKPDQITRENGDSVEFFLNRNGDITQYAAVKFNFQYQIQGLSASEVAFLQSTAETNLLNQVNGSDPTFQTVAYSGLSYPRCFLRSVTPSGPINVGPQQLINQTTVIYATNDRYLN